MKIYNTADPQVKPSVVMLVYGEGGTGKTTFASTAPKPILADCEGGAKYFGLRGIKLDVASIESWSDMKLFIDMVAKSDFQTVVIDPIGELMEKQKRFLVARNDAKLVQRDGSLTMAGWGALKDNMRGVIKGLRDLGRHVLIIAHVDEKMDDNRLVKRPLILTKISDEIVNMVDVVGYMTIARGEDNVSKRVIIVDPESDRYTAKDRTGQLGKLIEPDFTKIIAACQGTETFSWSKPQEVKAEAKETVTEKVAEPPVTVSQEEMERQAFEVDAIIDEIENSDKPYDNAKSILEGELFPLTPKQKVKLQSICLKYRTQSTQSSEQTSLNTTSSTS